MGSAQSDASLARQRRNHPGNCFGGLVTMPYLFPIMLAAGFLPRWAIALLGVSCAVLAELFSSLDRSFTRLLLEMLALAGCGLFVRADSKPPD